MAPESRGIKDLSGEHSSHPWRWIRRTLVLIAIPPLVLLVFLITEHVRGQVALACYEKTMGSKNTSVKISFRKGVKKISVFDENVGGKMKPQPIINGDQNG